MFQAYYQINQLASYSPSDIAWIGSIQLFCQFTGALFGGPLFDRYGAKVIWPPAVAFILSIMMISLCQELYQFLLAQGILCGMGIGMTMAPGMAAVGQYFRKKRAAAMGIAVAGSSLGGVVLPIAFNKMLNNPSLTFGWTVRIVGFIMIAVIIPSLLCIRARLPPRQGRFIIFEAFKNPYFVMLVIALFFMGLGAFTPIFYLPTYALVYGVNTELAFYLAAILNAASFFGRITAGILADKLGPLNILVIMATGTSILILCWQVITSTPSIIVMAVFYGFCSGAIISLITVCLAHVPKDPKQIGTYIGMGMFVLSFSVLAGPPINGALVSHYQDFKPAAIFSGTAGMVGTFLLLPVVLIARTHQSKAKILECLHFFKKELLGLMLRNSSLQHSTLLPQVWN